MGVLLPRDGHPTVDFALAYARLGLHVIPLAHISSVEHVQCGCSRGTRCDAIGKHPRMKGWRERATTDPTAIGKWWRDKPGSGIGIVTGRASGVVVLDIDPRNGGDESLFDLEQRYGKLPSTWETLTGGGGRHLYFDHPGGLAPLGSFRLAEGIDYQAEGKFVVAPPSMHVSGMRYYWEVEHLPGIIDLAELPDWVLAIRPDASPVRVERDVKDILLGVPEGERDVELYRYASRLRGIGNSRAEAEYLVGKAATACTPPMERAVVDKVIMSAWKHAPNSQHETATRTSFRIVRGREIETLPRPNWLVGDVLVERSLALLYGEPGVYKSFLALDLAGHISTGRPWHGHRTVRGKALYILAEGEGDIPDRVVAWRTLNGAGPIDDMDYVLGTVSLIHGGIDDLFDELGDDASDYSLVIVDTLARSMAGGDENAAKDMGLLIASCDQIRHRLNATVLLVHHSGKDGGRERGSSALKAAVDTVMKLEKGGKLVCEKQKTAAPFDPITFTLVESAESAALVSLNSTGETEDKEQVSLMVLDGVRLTATEWEQAALAQGISHATFYRTKKLLEKQGLVQSDGEGKGSGFTLTEAGMARLRSHG